MLYKKVEKKSKLITCGRCFAVLRDYVVCPYCGNLLKTED